MSLTVKNWQLKQLWHLYKDRELDLAPEYQRREAWTAKKSMVLIDSVARRIPINAITLYKTADSGALVYEVIDGKQRLTALIQFQEDRLIPLSEALRDLSEEEELEGKVLAEKVMDKKWSELDAGTRSAFLDYEVPIYVVEGSRASAVRAFRRMNADPYALTPQEIRNAIFKDSEFLRATRALSETIDKLAVGTDHFLVEWGVISPRQWLRMQDLQFLSELLCLGLDGPQEARRTLDTTYELYARPRGTKHGALKKAATLTAGALRAAHKILGGSLKPHLLSSENDVYALIGAIFKRGIPSDPQLAHESTVVDLRQTLSLFGNEILLCREAIQANEEDQMKGFAKEVKDYATTLLGGQINSAKRRQTRIDILASLINDRLAPIDTKNASDLQRRLVWAKSPDKICGRCGKKVDWKDYDCGHIDAKAFGGRAVVSNLRVEHFRCNRSARHK
jgi:hypothetical protein